MSTRACWLATWLVVITLAPAARATSSFVEFESGRVRPLPLSADGTHLFSVDTPDDRLEIINVASDGTLLPRTLASYSTHFVPDVLLPFGVRARSNHD